MAFTISLSPEAERRLQERALALGLEPAAYAAGLLEQTLSPTRRLEELSGDLYQRFVESGMTDDELGEELERAKHEMRDERRGRRAS